MESVIKFYLIGMLAAVIVQIVDFRRQMKANSKEHQEFKASFEAFKNSLEEIHFALGAAIGSLVVSLIVLLGTCVYLFMYPVTLFKMVVRLFHSKNA